MTAKLKGIAPTDIIEKKSRISLEQILSIDPNYNVEVTSVRDKYPNLDGFIEFFDKDLKPINMKVFFQIKATEIKNEKHYDCEIAYLTYYFKEPYPILFIFVNLKDKKIYIEMITKQYIQKKMGIADPETFKQDKKRIKFTKEFLGDIAGLIMEYKKDSRDLTSNLMIDSEIGEASPAEVKSHKKDLISAMGVDKEKIYDLEAVLFFNYPLYINDEDSLSAIRDKLGITKSEFDFYIERMKNIGFINIVGDLISFNDARVAKALLDDLITREGMDYLTKFYE